MHRTVGLLVILLATGPASADLRAHLETIRKVDHEGIGNREASKAWQVVKEADRKEIPQILEAMDGANPLAQNWLRAAVDSILEKRPGNNQADLVEYIQDDSHETDSRELAYSWLKQLDESRAEAMIPAFLNDASVGLRRLAVQQRIDAASALREKETGKAIPIYKEALAAARSVDQVQEIAKALRNLKQTVDLPRHFGFLTKWKVIGPFDNTDRDGFATAYPPENAPSSKVDLNARYPGKNGVVQWQDLVSEDEYGMVDLNDPFGPLKEVVGYAYTEFNVDEAQKAQLRLGCKNAWKVWLNGKLLFERDEYHRGMRIDQYLMQAPLKEGTNRILVKLCQNEQKEHWTKEWQFQLRVCDSTGTAIHADQPPTFSQKSTASLNQ